MLPALDSQLHQFQLLSPLTLQPKLSSFNCPSCPRIALVKSLHPQTILTYHCQRRRALIAIVGCTSSILDLTQKTDITAATHLPQDEQLLRMVKYRRERIPRHAVQMLMLVFGKIAPGHSPVDRQWTIRTGAACGNGIPDVIETAAENATTTVVDGLQEVVIETGIEKDTARPATTAAVEAKARGEIDHLTMEDHLAEK